MARRLPPLNALRAFEAAARHLSFTKAAEELYVTQAAISHQVKALEAALDLQLFRRLNRRLMLTDAGQLYLPALTEAFDAIDTASARLRADENAGRLVVSVANSLAAKWLLPRLPRFRDRHPEIEVEISAADRLVDFGRDNVDMALRYGLGNYPGLRVDPLMKDTNFPVCSPELLAGPISLSEPGDLRRHNLLHDAGNAVSRVKMGNLSTPYTGDMVALRWRFVGLTPLEDTKQTPQATPKCVRIALAVAKNGNPTCKKRWASTAV
ncbi:MAG: LysR family transcriptional regulator, partial [Proteobacteria bacterium]|nr:LysR family transcriptional regulator [Pseudomonadota bacterium]